MDITECNILTTFLNGCGYPLKFTKDQKRRLREKASSFLLQDGELHHKMGKHVTRVVIGDAEKERILISLHAGSVGGGHFGQNSTIQKITERFWWPGVTNDTKKFVQRCVKCQMANSSNRPPPAILNPVQVNHIFERWGIDLVGPLNETREGMKYIIVATEYLTKWAEVKAIPDKSADSVHDFLMELVFRFGSCNVILHDQGREFNNNLVRDLCAKMNISQAMSSAYHPQTNGF